MALLVIAAGSKDYIQVPVAAEEAGAAINPTALTVKMAFIAGATEPSAGDLKSASWDTDATTTPATYWAQCLVGPGGTITLTPGIYQVWVQVTDSPEIPLLPCGPLKVV